MCLTSHTFYRLRRGVMEVGEDSTRYWPATPTVSAIGTEGRRKVWDELRQTLGLSLPELRRPAWVIAINVGLALLGGFLVTHALTGGISSSYFLIGVAFACGILWLLHYSTRPLATEPPTFCKTLGELARETLTINFHAISKATKSWSEREVWETLKALVVRKTGVPIEAVTRDARFTVELRMD